MTKEQLGAAARVEPSDIEFILAVLARRRSVLEGDLLHRMRTLNDPQRVLRAVAHMVDGGLVSKEGDRLKLTDRGLVEASKHVAIPASRMASGRGANTVVSSPLSEAFYAHLARFADRERRPMAWIIREALANYMAQKGDPAPEESYREGATRRRSVIDQGGE